MSRGRSTYDRFPAVEAPGRAHDARRGWDAIAAELNEAIAHRRGAAARCVVAVECYPGLLDEAERELRARLRCGCFLSTREAFLPPDRIDTVCRPYLGGDDPLFGFYCPLTMADFLEPERVAALQANAADAAGATVVFGPGALLCCSPALVVYADLPRWEGQLRQRRGEVSNLGVENRGLKPSLQYKRSFFVDWRVADRLKKATMPRWDYLLDTTAPGDPRLMTGHALREGLALAARRPFRVMPFFDPAPWGGHWAKEVCGLDPRTENSGWCFDCVPEENSLLLRCGDTTIEIPSLNLVFARPRELLGDAVYDRFGAEFPIRFDFLDTMGGGHLSLQVHPVLDYARQTFGLRYTQDESYYLMDAGTDASVFLGLRTGIDPSEMLAALEAAQAGGPPFLAERFVNRWPAKKHDHFLIPAGTVHGSGVNGMVLEISATPYIFTFKLWDWDRPGLDGLPRPINLGHGRNVIQWNRTTEWVRAHLLNRVERLGEGPGWREERTGLHESEFIETRRHWFTGPAPHDPGGGVNVLNLVEGTEAVVESPDGAFEPFAVHYAETFIVPAAAGRYTLRPHGPSVGRTCAIIKAYVRAAGPRSPPA